MGARFRQRAKKVIITQPLRRLGSIRQSTTSDFETATRVSSLYSRSSSRNPSGNPSIIIHNHSLNPCIKFCPMDILTDHDTSPWRAVSLRLLPVRQLVRVVVRIVRSLIQGIPPAPVMVTADFVEFIPNKEFRGKTRFRKKEKFSLTELHKSVYSLV